MAWQLFDTTLIGKPFQILQDDRFAGNLPGEELPNLTWFGIWCRMDTEGGFWNLAETDALAQIEEDLLKLASEFGNGWVVYVRRAISAGKYEYFFYSGEDAHLQEALKPLQDLHPEYRIEYDSQPDRNGLSTQPGSRKRRTRESYEFSPLIRSPAITAASMINGAHSFQLSFLVCALM